MGFPMLIAVLFDIFSNIFIFAFNKIQIVLFHHLDTQRFVHQIPRLTNWLGKEEIQFARLSIENNR